MHCVIYNGETIIEEPARTLALGSVWQDVFQEKPFDELPASHCLTELGNFGEFSPNIHAPDYSNFYNSLQHRPNSLPGPDCISFAGWKAAGDLGIACMQKVDGLLREDQLPPDGDDYNDSIVAFLVKEEKADDAVAVNRDAMEMRTLSMKNCFNKVIMAANCNALNSEYAEITHETQNGFTGGRNVYSNLLLMILLVVCTPVLMRAPRNLFLPLVLYLYLLPVIF